MSENKTKTPERKLFDMANYYGSRYNVRTERLLELLFVAQKHGMDANEYCQLWEAAYGEHDHISIFDLFEDGYVDALFESI